MQWVIVASRATPAFNLHSANLIDLHLTHSHVDNPIDYREATMIDGRRTLRLSLALNAVLVLGAWIGFWFLSTDKLSQLCKPSSVHSLLGDLAEPPLDDSYPQAAVATEPTSKSCDICASDVGKDLCDKYG